MANNPYLIFSFIEMSDRDLKFVYLFSQTDTFLFVIETPIRKCKHNGFSTCTHVGFFQLYVHDFYST
jgi:hypothetical protein